MRLIGLTLAALLAAAGMASAQVAAPLLNPTPPVFSAPNNPAVLIWDAPSRVAAQLARLTIDAPPGTRFADGTSRGLLGAAVGEYVAAGAAVQRLHLDADASAGGGSIQIDSSTVDLAAQIASVVSLGVGQERSKLMDTTVGGSGVPQEETLPVAGFTVRLANIFYVGGAGGTVKFSRGPASYDRRVRRLGVAVLDMAKDGGVHLEVYRERKAPAGAIDDGSDTKGLSAEVIWGSILLGYLARSVDKANDSGILTGTNKIAAVSLGWVPQARLSIVLTGARDELRDPAGTATGRFSTREVGAAWKF